MSDTCQHKWTRVASAGGIRKACEHCGFSILLNFLLNKKAKQ